MDQGRWITVEEATAKLKNEPGVISVKRERKKSGEFLMARNFGGATIIQWRIFDGSEHAFAKPGMLVDYDRKGGA